MSVKNCESCGRFFNDQGLSDLFGSDFDKYCSPECARKVVGAIDRDVVVGDETQSDSDGTSLLPTAGGCIKLIVKIIIIIAVVMAVIAYVGKSTDRVSVVTQPEHQTARTPDISIHEAASEGYPEVVKRLLAAGADVNLRDDAGRTLLHEASYAGHKEIVELLITKGADLNAKGLLDGGTPLHFATFRGHKEVVELLITKGADLNVRMNNGKLPLHMAFEMNHGQIADLIRKHGKAGDHLKAEGK